MKSPIQPTFLIFSHQTHLKNVRKMPQLPWNQPLLLRRWKPLRKLLTSVFQLSRKS
jgi:hypothetical protein